LRSCFVSHISFQGFHISFNWVHLVGMYLLIGFSIPFKVFNFWIFPQQVPKTTCTKILNLSTILKLKLHIASRKYC
jgi:hypothetical protein